MAIVLAMKSAVLLDLPTPVESGWHVRPGMHSVARPYDADTVARPLSETTLQEQPSHENNVRPSKRRKVRSHDNSNTDGDQNENEIVTWIRQELSALRDTKEARKLFQDHLNEKYGTLVHQPASEEFAIDFAGQANMLKLLKHGFGRQEGSCGVSAALASFHKEAEDDEAEPFDSLCLHQGTNYVEHISHVYETAVCNPFDTTTLLALPSNSPLDASHYVVPPRSMFIMSDFDQIHRLTTITTQPELLGGFDLIVMDPPWSNASVERMAHYSTMDMYELFKLPIPKLLSSHPNHGNQTSSPLSPELSLPQPVVAVWITNRPKVFKLVVEKLFPAWGIELVACWYWLKVTTKGEPVLSLENRHRRPYERILIGRKRASHQSPSTSSLSSRPPSEARLTTKVVDRKLIVSVPGLHSRKPCLGQLIEDEFFTSRDLHQNSNDGKHLHATNKKQVKKLELFARNLEPGWVSWGNEPLRFQYCGHGKCSSSSSSPLPPHAEFVQDGFLVPGRVNMLTDDQMS